MSEWNKDSFVFLDLETTGLNPQKDKILEIGVIVTDPSLTEMDGYSVVINQPDSVLEKMVEWCQTTHTRTGLTDSVRDSVITTKMAEEAILSFLGRLSNDPPYRMCGCSIHFDRRFLGVHMPTLEKWFYYGNLDVSSVGATLEMITPLPYYASDSHGASILFKPWEEKEAHRVNPDNLDAILELRYYYDVMWGIGRAR